MTSSPTYVLHDREQVTVREHTPERLVLDAQWAPGPHKPLPHLHPAQDETFAVHAGELTVRLPDGEHVLGAGDALAVPRGTVHAMWNSGAEPCRATWTVSPALGTEAFFRTVHELRAQGRHGKDGALTLVGGAAVLRAFPREMRMPWPAPVQAVALWALGAVARLRGYRVAAA